MAESSASSESARIAQRSSDAYGMSDEGVQSGQRHTRSVHDGDSHLRVLFDSLFEFIGLLAPDGTVLDANEPALRFIGASRRDVLGRSFWDTPWWSHAPEQQARLKRAIADAARGGFSRFETEHIGRNGQRMRLDFSLTPLLDEVGRVTYLIPEGRDITQREKVESELRDALVQHKALLASTLDPIVTIDDRGVIQTVSDSIKRVFGYSPDELIGKNVSILMAEPDRSLHDASLERYRRTGQAYILGATRELAARRKSGEVFPIELSVSRVSVPGRERALFIGIIHDITERKQAEQEIQLLQNLTMSISTQGDIDSAFLEAIESICRATGWEYGEVWLPSGDRATLESGPNWQRDDRAFEHFREQSRGVSFAPGEGLIGRVWLSKKPEWIEDIGDSDSVFARREAATEAGLKAALAIPILFRNEVVAILVFFMGEHRREDRRQVELVTTAVAALGPIVQRKHYEDALQQSERRFRQVLNDVEILAVMIDCDGRIVFVDDFLLRVTGWSRDEIIGKDWFENFIPKKQRARVRSIFLEGLQTGQIKTQYENDIVTRDGTHRRIAWSNTMMRDPDGAITGAMAFGVDVTDQRQMQVELEKHRRNLEELVAQRTAELEETHEQLRVADRLASIGTLAAGLGHDMNNVLLPARCSLDVLEALGLPEGAHDQVKSLRRSLNYLRQLTDGLRLFALDPEDAEATASVTQLRDWWEHVGPLLSRAAKNARFSAVIDADLPPIAVPSHRLTQAMLNLIVNAGEAIDANADGEVRLRIRAMKDRRFIRLSVTDNGCGMSDEVKRHALDPFFTTKKRGLGTGFGLSLVRGVVESAGGSVQIRSSEGRGTSVVLMLPVAQPPEGDEDNASNVESGWAAVISVDDTRASSFLATMLRADGFQVSMDDPAVRPKCALWIVQPTARREPILREYHDDNEGQLIVFGSIADHQSIPRAIVIRKTENFEAIRRSIGEAASLIRESSNDGTTQRAAAHSVR